MKAYSKKQNDTRISYSKKWAILQQPGQSFDLSPIKHAFQILKTKLKAENLKQAAAAGVCSNGLAETLREENTAFGDVHDY